MSWESLKAFVLLGSCVAIALGITGVVAFRLIACRAGAAVAAFTMLLGLNLGGPAILSSVGRELFGGSGEPTFYRPQHWATGALLLVIGLNSFFVLWAVDAKTRG